MHPAETHRLQINQALQILLDQESYTQAEIEKKLKALDFKISRPSLSNLYRQKTTSPKFLKTAAMGLSALLRREHCLEWEASGYVKIKDCKPSPILIADKSAIGSAPLPQQNAIIHDGRIDVPDKVAFYQQAKIEIIEIGLRLNNFSSYFEKKRESAFKDPLNQLLEEGVNIKCYVLDPSAGGFARKYFEDRARVQLSEKEVLNTLKDSMTVLRDQFLEINKNGHAGKIKLYTYPHFPYFHASAVDMNSERGALYISPYLYGLSRANTPVIEVSQKSSKRLFKKYSRSVSAIIKQAHQIV